MRTFHCQCGAPLFFHNTSCLQCGSDVGYCPACRQVVALKKPSSGSLICADPACGAALFKCHNFHAACACNWCIAAQEAPGASLCRSCRLTRVIPDLSILGNPRRWAELERAKRRLLYTLDMLQLDYSGTGDCLPLAFEFKGDPIDPYSWQPLAGGQEVFTGHAGGTITINVREADSVERERDRIQFGESLRTTIGHFRHEIGHYYWERLVKNRCEDAFAALFGDHHHLTYEQAQDRYYQQGPPPDWQQRHVSAYASMHPWEDFAETFNTYLDMASLLDTAAHFHFIPHVDLRGPLGELAAAYVSLGIGLNEMNREMGLLDPVPVVLTPAVIDKLDFIHGLVLNQVTVMSPA